MGDTVWLAIQALGTLAVVIALALLSRRRTRQMLANRWPRKPSALARAVPDPHLRPDPEVTDAFHVTDAHRGAAPGDRSKSGHSTKDAGLPETGRVADRSSVASNEHPSAVERLDGLVDPSDGAGRDGGGADATDRPRAPR